MEVRTTLAHFSLLVVSVAAGASGLLPATFAVTGAVVGGGFLFAALARLAARRPTTGVAAQYVRALVAVHMLLLPLQVTALVGAALENSEDVRAEARSYRLEGSIYCAWGLASGVACYIQGRQLSFDDGEGENAAGARMVCRRLTRIMGLELLVVAMVGGSRTIALGSWFASSGGQHEDDLSWLWFLWVVCYVAAALLVAISAFVVCTWCFLGRDEFAPLFTVLGIDGADRLTAAHESLASSPASALLAPYLWHFMVMVLPLTATLGVVVFQGDPVAYAHRALVVADIGQGVVVVVLVAASSLAEALRPTWTPCIWWTNFLSAAIIFFGRCASPLALAEDGDSKALYRVGFASEVLFWELYTLYYIWGVVNCASEYISGHLWEIASSGYFSSAFYPHEDAKGAGEAAFGSIAGSAALTLILIPLDVSALVVCSRAFEAGRCSLGALRTVQVACGASALWLSFTLFAVVLTRLKGPPAVIVWNQHVWLLDIVQYCAEASTLALMVLEFTFVCNFDPPRGPAKALILTSAIFRLSATPLIVLIDLSTRKERWGAYTNALGTAALVRLREAGEQHSEQAAIDVAEVSLSMAADEPNYGATESCLPFANLQLADAKQLPFEAKVRWFRGHIASLRVPWESGHEELIFNRGRLLEESKGRFLALSGSDFRKIFRFDFADEPGLDAGGVAREFFTLLAEELTKRSYVVPALGPDGEVAIQLPPHPAPHLVGAAAIDAYRFVGRWMAKAIFDGQTIALHWARPIYRRILGLPTSREDLMFYDYALHTQLESLQQMEPSQIADLSLDFSASYNMEAWEGEGAAIVTRNLESNERAGAMAVASRKEKAPRDVDESNVAQYVDLRWRRRVEDDIAPQMAALLEGVYDVLPQSTLSVFNHEELDLLACGVEVIDVADWRNNTDYLGAFQRERMVLRQSHPQRVLTWFWQVVEGFDQSHRRRLLRFATGSSRVPVGGFAALLGNDGRLSKFTIQPVEVTGDSEMHLLPRAHTCFNRLDLPLYRSKQELQRVLTQVLVEDMAIQGFGMD